MVMIMTVTINMMIMMYSLQNMKISSNYLQTPAI